MWNNMFLTTTFITNKQIMFNNYFQTLVYIQIDPT